MSTSATEAAKLLRKLADAIEGGKAARWAISTEAVLVDVSTLSEARFVENGQRAYVVSVTTGGVG